MPRSQVALEPQRSQVYDKENTVWTSLTSLHTVSYINNPINTDRNVHLVVKPVSLFF